MELVSRAWRRAIRPCCPRSPSMHCAARGRPLPCCVHGPSMHELHTPTHPALQDTVTCVGQPLGIVAADSEDAARAAAAAVVVEYEDLPAILDIEEAIAGGWDPLLRVAGRVRACWPGGGGA